MQHKNTIIRCIDGMSQRCVALCMHAASIPQCPCICMQYHGVVTAPLSRNETLFWYFGCEIMLLRIGDILPLDFWKYSLIVSDSWFLQDDNFGFCVSHRVKLFLFWLNWNSAKSFYFTSLSLVSEWIFVRNVAFAFPPPKSMFRNQVPVIIMIIL